MLELSVKLLSSQQQPACFCSSNLPLKLYKLEQQWQLCLLQLRNMSGLLAVFIYQFLCPARLLNLSSAAGRRLSLESKILKLHKYFEFVMILTG